MRDEIKAIIKAGVTTYENNRDVDPRDCFKFLYQEIPDELKSQAAEFDAALKREGVDIGH